MDLKNTALIKKVDAKDHKLNDSRVGKSVGPESRFVFAGGR